MATINNVDVPMCEILSNALTVFGIDTDPSTYEVSENKFIFNDTQELFRELVEGADEDEIYHVRYTSNPATLTYVNGIIVKDKDYAYCELSKLQEVGVDVVYGEDFLSIKTSRGSIKIDCLYKDDTLYLDGDVIEMCKVTQDKTLLDIFMELENTEEVDIVNNEEFLLDEPIEVVENNEEVTHE